MSEFLSGDLCFFRDAIVFDSDKTPDGFNKLNRS